MVGVMDGNYRMALTTPESIFWSMQPTKIPDTQI